MSTTVNAYFAPTASGPQPVTVNVNSAGVPLPPGTPSSGVSGASFGADQFASIATQAAPYAPTAFSGIRSVTSMGEARASFARAKASSRATVRTKSMAVGRTAAFGGVLSAVKSSVIFNGLFSLAINGYGVFTKKQSTADGAANVAGDLSSAVVGGAAGGIATAAGTALLGTMGVAGLPLTLATFALGAGAYFVADAFFRKTPFFQSIKDGVHKLFG